MSNYSHQESDTSANGLAGSAHDLAAHAEELMHSTAAISGESVAMLRSKLTESLRVAREQISNVQEQAMQRGRHAVTATDSWVHEKPWQAIAAASLIGLVIGYMSRRASSSR